MPKGLFKQILIILLAIGIVFFYVQPQFTYISDTQDLIVTYKEERQKVTTVNSRLSDLVTDMDGVSATDINRLVTYMPNTVDTVAVQRDIKQIVDESGAIYAGVSSEGELVRPSAGDSEGETDSVSTQSYQFSLSVEGTYDQLKQVLSLLERNNYPLQIESFTLTSLEGGFMSADMTLVTYSLESAAEDEVEEFEF